MGRPGAHLPPPLPLPNGPKCAYSVPLARKTGRISGNLCGELDHATANSLTRRGNASWQLNQATFSVTWGAMGENHVLDSYLLVGPGRPGGRGR